MRVDLVLVEAKPREARDVQNLVAVDHAQMLVDGSRGRRSRKKGPSLRRGPKAAV